MAEPRTAHPYFMHDAIRQQPERVAAVLREQKELLERAAEAAAGRNRLFYAGIGTSLHAATLGERFLRHLSGGRVLAQVEHSFEQVHYPLALSAEDAVVVTSHRGWKNYSVQALRAARASGALTLSITGNDGGAGIREADFVVTTCEQEISFAHTKSYTAALAALAELAIGVVARRGLLADSAAPRAALAAVPRVMEQSLAVEPQTRAIAPEIARRERWFFIGSGFNAVTAQEGALKAKEAAYIAAEGIETEQFLHGPLAEADARAVLLALAPGGPGDARMRDVLQAAGELGVLRVAIQARGQAALPAEHRIEIPAVEEWLSPFTQIIPVQFLAYWVALERGANPDTGREDQPAHARAKQHFQL